MSEPKIVLAFDFGKARTGVAIGNTMTMQAQPLTIIATKVNEEKWKNIEALIHEWGPALFVVGVPCHPDGSPHEMTALALKFARQLRGRYRIRVNVVDERYSSVVVENGREKIDDEAAAVILQQWFDEGCPDRGPSN